MKTKIIKAAAFFLFSLVAHAGTLVSDRAVVPRNAGPDSIKNICKAKLIEMCRTVPGATTVKQNSINYRPAGAGSSRGSTTTTVICRGECNDQRNTPSPDSSD